VPVRALPERDVRRDTLIITYDEQRGEPRGARKKGTDAKAKGLGDCVDCTMCVQVCPTGIDIRKGLQYECIACAACIDACDEVMEKVGYPKGLIRYDTQHGLEGKAKHVVRPRTIVYATLISALILGFAYTLTQRNVVGVDVIRDRNALFRELPGGMIENVYNVKILNKDQAAHEFTDCGRSARHRSRLRRRRSAGRPRRRAERRGAAARASRRTARRRGHHVHDPHRRRRTPAAGHRQGPFPRTHELIGFTHDDADRAPLVQADVSLVADGATGSGRHRRVHHAVPRDLESGCARPQGLRA
jgi:ferredoxin